MSDTARTFTVSYSGEFEVTLSAHEIEPGMSKDEIESLIDEAIDAEHARAGALEFNSRERTSVVKWAREIATKKPADATKEA